jgi:serine O-acetyltransferase
MADVNGSERRPDGLRGDIDRLFSDQGTWLGKPPLPDAVRKIVTRPGPLAIVLYRIGHRLWQGGHHLLAELLWRLSVTLTGADIHPGAQIGGGLRVDHTSGLVIAREAVIGSNVTIHHGVTIGGSGRRWFDPDYQDGAPVIGDETEIWAGAKVVGPIRVGRGCYVGANAVLAHDLADGTAHTVGSLLRDLKARVDALEARAARAAPDAPRPSDVSD